MPSHCSSFKPRLEYRNRLQQKQMEMIGKIYALAKRFDTAKAT